MSSHTYLQLNEIRFEGAAAPSEVAPLPVVIKTEETSVNGTVNVDVIARKVKLAISWSVLHDADMRRLLGAVEADTVTVRYVDAQKGETTVDAYLTDCAYRPFFYGDEIRWRDVRVELTQLKGEGA